MERHHNAGHKNARVICWLISLLVIIASPSLVLAALTCDQCHGGYGTVGVKDSPTGTRDPATGIFRGNHGTHLPGTQTVAQCTVCHGANVATYGSTHSTISKNQIQMAAKIDNYSGLKRARYGTRLFWNMTTLPDSKLTTCSNVNCHFERATDTWGLTAAYTAGDLATCGKCHDALPTTAAHSKHIVAYGGGLTSCNRCHSDYAAATPARMKFQHATSAGRPIKVTVPYTPVDSNYLPGKMAQGRNFSSCATTYCHSSGQSLTSATNATPAYVAVSWSTTGTNCNSAICHPTSRAATVSGSHTKHLAQASIQCANCHTGVSTDGATYGFGTTHINNLIDVAASVNYTIAGTPGNGYGTCSNVSCHNNGTTDAVQPTIPSWGATGLPNCSVCHLPSPTTGSHAKHMNVTSFKAIACGDCHTGANSTTGGPGHLNNLVDVTGLAPIAKHPSTSYTTTCATNYCHSSGQSLTNGTVVTPVYVAPIWGATGTAGCGTCHPATRAATVSASHAKHMTSTVKVIGCNDCHANVSSNGTSYTGTTHVDAQIDVLASQAYDRAGAPGNGYGTCATGTCHNDGTLASGRTVQWGAAQAACAACHAATPTTGAHIKHFSLNATKFASTTVVVTCASCHAGANATTGGPGHFNNTVEVTGYTASPVARHAVGAYTGTCSISCHGDGAAQNVATGWGVVSTGCDFCHPMANLGGAHQKHAGSVALNSTTRSYGNYTANFSNGADAGVAAYGFGCANCHPTDVTKHINNVVDVELTDNAASVGALRKKNIITATTTRGTWNGSTLKTCDVVYCHSDGINPMALGGNGAAPNWNNPFVGDRCAKCHGNLPTTGAHRAHKVGIHYDNIFSGTSGFLGYSSSGNKAHGVSTQSTTLSCNICHASTVNTAYNKNGSTCTSCHSADAGVALLDATNGFKFHVNGKVDVSFKDINVRSKAQIRETSFSAYSGIWTRNGGISNYKKDATSYDIAKQSLSASAFTAGGTQGQGSCANVACHNLRTGQTVTWNQTLQCVDCHSQL